MNAPKIDRCTRTGDGLVSFVLSTQRGDAFASVNRHPPKPKYVLNMPGADDHASCSLNGSQIASIPCGKSVMNLELKAGLKEGQNTLSCKAEDLKPGNNGLHSWSYAFELFQNGVKIGSPSFSCNDNSPRCGSKGETVSTTFVF